MNGREHVVAGDAFGNQDSVFVVVAVPGHVRHQHVASQSQFAQLRRTAVGDDVALRDDVADLDQRVLGDAGRLVGTLEFAQFVDVDARFVGFDLARGADDDAHAVDGLDDAVALRDDGGAGVARDRRFHARADQRRVGLQQRHGLTLHV